MPITDASSRISIAKEAAKAIPPPEVALIAALDALAPDAALGEAFRLIASGERASPVLVLAMGRALTRNGAPGIAQRLFGTMEHQLTQAGANIADLIAEIRTVPSGELSAETLRGQLAANCAALLPSRPHLQGIEHLLTAEDASISIFRTRQCNLQVIRDAQNHAWRFVFSYGDHRKDAAAVNFGKAAPGTSFLLLGVPTIPLLERMLAMRCASGFEPPIDIIEPDLSILRTWLCLSDLTAAFSGARMNVFAGPHAMEQYERFRITHLHRGEPTHVITLPRPASQPPVFDQDQRRRVATAVRRRRQELYERQESLYRDSAASSRGHRFSRSREEAAAPLRIVGFTTRYSTVMQHAMRDLASAFRRRGCTFDMVCEPDCHSTEIDTWSVLAERRYDLVVVINHLRSEYHKRITPLLPYVCWVQDHMLQICRPEAGRSVDDLELVLIQHPWLLETFYEYPRDRLLETSNLTDQEIYAHHPAPASMRQRLTCDLAYVSHGSQTVEQLIEQSACARPDLAPFLRRLLSLMKKDLEESCAINSSRLYRMIVEAERESRLGPLSPATRGLELTPVALKIYDRLLRHQTLQWAAEWARERGRSLRLYGRGWEDHPELAGHAAGEVSNGEELRAVYQAAAINMQVNAYGSLHQRLLDCLACGGFIVTRYNPNDFLRRPLVELQSKLVGNGIESVSALFAACAGSSDLRRLIDEVHRLGGLGFDFRSERSQQEELRLLREVAALPDECLSDEGFVATLREGRFIPARSACDLPAFEDTVFSSREEMWTLLDRFADEPESRHWIASQMRADVIAHDTFDGLVTRILDHFAGLLNCRST